MSIFVGPSLYPYGRMIMCHMASDSLEELHEMADRIGVSRKWFQNTRYPHYDICKAKRWLAVGFGAFETDERGIIYIGRLWREQRETT
jgi:hypothetical protein